MFLVPHVDGQEAINNSNMPVRAEYKLNIQGITDTHTYNNNTLTIL